MSENQKDHHFKIRLTSQLKEDLEKAADRNYRSLTNEILLRLSASVGLEKRVEENSQKGVEELSREEAELLVQMWTVLSVDQREAVLMMIRRLVA